MEGKSILPGYSGISALFFFLIHPEAFEKLSLLSATSSEGCGNLTQA